MRKHWKALTAVGVVILAVAVAVILINRPAPAREPDPSSLQASGKFGFPVSDIKIGEGGTKKASDGKTITGYNGTCDSAAQAAANYTPLIEDVNLKTWAQQKKTLTEVSNPGPWLEKVTFKGNLRHQCPRTCQRVLLMVAGGTALTWRPVACTGSPAAKTEKTGGCAGVLWWPWRQCKRGTQGFFQTVTFELAWDGDWKISDAASSP